MDSALYIIYTFIIWLYFYFTDQRIVYYHSAAAHRPVSVKLFFTLIPRNRILNCRFKNAPNFNEITMKSLSGYFHVEANFSWRKYETLLPPRLNCYERDKVLAIGLKISNVFAITHFLNTLLNHDLPRSERVDAAYCRADPSPSKTHRRPRACSK